MERQLLQCRFEYLNCGSRSKSSCFTPHSHQAYELVYYMKGSGSITIHGKKYEYFPGACAITEPDHLHGEYHAEETYVIYIVFSYKGSLLHLADGIVFDNTGNSIRHILEEMRKEFYTQSGYFKIKLDLLTEQLIIELARIYDRQQPSENLSLAIQYLNENCTAKIDFNALAERSGYSYSHFRRIIKKHTGLSPVNYVIQQRLENSKYLLRCTSLPVAHISQECGFSSESQFCCLFKRFYQLTPRTFRNNVLTGSATERLQ